MTRLHVMATYRGRLTPSLTGTLPDILSNFPDMYESLALAGALDSSTVQTFKEARTEQQVSSHLTPSLALHLQPTSS